jgi:hypothetical protein
MDSAASILGGRQCSDGSCRFVLAMLRCDCFARRRRLLHDTSVAACHLWTLTLRILEAGVAVWGATFQRWTPLGYFSTRPASSCVITVRVTTTAARRFLQWSRTFSLATAKNTTFNTHLP